MNWGNKCSTHEGKKTFEIRFPCKNGLKQWWAEHSYCTRSPLLTYKIIERLSSRSGFACSIPFFWHPYATVLLMSTAFSHTLWYRNLFVVIIQEMTRLSFFSNMRRVSENVEELRYVRGCLLTMPGITFWANWGENLPTCQTNCYAKGTLFVLATKPAVFAQTSPKIALSL